MSSDSWPPKQTVFPSYKLRIKHLSTVSVSQLQVAQLAQIGTSSRYPAVPSGCPVVEAGDCNPRGCDPSGCEAGDCNPNGCDSNSSNPVGFEPIQCDPGGCNPFSCDPFVCNPYGCNPFSCDPVSCNPLKSKSTSQSVHIRPLPRGPQEALGPNIDNAIRKCFFRNQ